jgi:hypothetical protein
MSSSLRFRLEINVSVSAMLFVPQDFGDVIPGHGGIMDRFDCQYLMATFVNVYISSFIHTASPQKLLQQVCKYILLFLSISIISLLQFKEGDRLYRLRFEVFMAVTTNNAAFSDVTPCGSC